MSDDSKHFWVVWQPEGGPPRMRHETRGSADDEAKRLALANPGRRFYVLKAMSFAEHNAVRTVQLGQGTVDAPW